MKTVSFSIPCFNEKENIPQLVENLVSLFQNNYPQYQLKIEFIDNCSTDGTIEELRKVCNKYPNIIKATINSRNFGGVSSYYGLLKSKGDCTIVIPSDFQVPLGIIPQLIEEWENGAKVVCAIKSGSLEKKRLMPIRKLYYKIVEKYSEFPQISNFTGAGLYDKGFIDWLKSLDEPVPSLRNLVAEYGAGIAFVSYNEKPRRWGHSKNDFSTLVYLATRNLLMFTSLVPAFALCCCIICLGISFFIVIAAAIVSIIFKTSVVIYIILAVVFALASIFLFFAYMLFIYLQIIDKKITHHPLVVENEYIDYSNQEIDKI